MDSPVLDLALDLARHPAAGLDPAVFLPELCAALAAALGLPAAALVTSEPEGAFGSDGAARRIADVQRREGAGPVVAAARTGRVLPAPDLGRVGPPALAAAAAGCGLVSSVAVPLGADGRHVAGLHLLGTRTTPVTARHVEAARPVLEVLGALLANMQAQHQLVSALAREAESRRHAAPIEQATGVLAERYHTDVEEAARYLESQALADGRPLVAAAEAVVAGAARPAPVPRPRSVDDGSRPRSLDDRPLPRYRDDERGAVPAPRPGGLQPGPPQPRPRVTAAAPGPVVSPSPRPRPAPALPPRTAEPPRRRAAEPAPFDAPSRDGAAPRARHRRTDAP